MACVPQALEEIAVVACRFGVITIGAPRAALGMESPEQALAFVGMLG